MDLRRVAQVNVALVITPAIVHTEAGSTKGLARLFGGCQRCVLVLRFVNSVVRAVFLEMFCRAGTLSGFAVNVKRSSRAGRIGGSGNNCGHGGGGSRGGSPRSNPLRLFKDTDCACFGRGLEVQDALDLRHVAQVNVALVITPAIVHTEAGSTKGLARLFGGCQRCVLVLRFVNSVVRAVFLEMFDRAGTLSGIAVNVKRPSRAGRIGGSGNKRGGGNRRGSCRSSNQTQRCEGSIPLPHTTCVNGR